ncbi:patatin-like phospholipase family protein [Roseiconus lacunae]|uniref:patatin-like phospholipase family protein n=1 Tax=Roseiconus lacunae TaxID=2605694 RepID=UPI0011F0EF8D|nr:patatin-like phospholipase family protein [Roseiconus lacunae]MCD0458860.1 patatin-like phospholipase family protein [Roseiconus lacunae]
MLRRPRSEWADATVMLGGGGARGLAHLGAVRAIGHSGLGIGRLVGVSMGALMASLIAAERDVERAESMARDFLISDRYRALQKTVLDAAIGTHGKDETNDRWLRRWRSVFWIQKAISRAARTESLLPATLLETITDELLPDINIEDLRLPLHLIAVDLKTGERISLSEGPLRQAVRASMSIPGIFPAVEIDGRRLSDVGVYDAVPCDIAIDLMSGQGELIVVDVSPTESSNADCRTAIQSILRFQELAESRIRQQQLKLADLVVRPQVGSVAWFDFTNPDPLIEAGYDAAHAVLQQS